MHTPFTLVFDVEEVNIESRPEPLPEKYEINVTIMHKVGDIKHSIWVRSKDYGIRPNFVKIKHRGVELTDATKLADVLQCVEAPSERLNGEFVLVVDYLLFNSPSIPRRYPEMDIFDVVVQWRNNDKDERMRIRETLDCTIGVIKDYLIEDRLKLVPNESEVNRDYFVLTLESNGQVCGSEDESLYGVLKLDVPPLTPVIFKLSFKTPVRPASPNGRGIRFLIQIESDIESLQEGANLFEVNTNTKLYEFKQQLIDKIDYMSVKRTFYDQIKLTYNGHLIENTESTDQKEVYSILGLDRRTLEQTHGITRMKLKVVDNLSGTEGGIFSRQFFRDLSSPHRFQFLPNVSNDLRPRSSSHEENTASIPEANPPHILHSQKVVLGDSREYVSTGETYELMKPSPDSGHGEPNTKAVLVNQLGLSPKYYEFSLVVEGVTKTVKLNTSQCIIFEKGIQQPYVALSPSGSSKLCAAFENTNGASLVQEARISFVESPRLQSNRGSSTDQSITTTTEQTRAANIGVPNAEVNNDAPVRGNNAGVQLNERVPERLATWFTNWVGRRFKLFIQVAILVYFYQLNGLLIRFWRPLLCIVLACWALHLVLLRGNRSADFIETTLIPAIQGNAPNPPQGIHISSLRATAAALRFVEQRLVSTAATLRSELVMYAVDRKSDFQHIIGEHSVWAIVSDNMENALKDIMLALLALSPAVYSEITEALATTRQRNQEELNTMSLLQLQGLSLLIDDYTQICGQAPTIPNQEQLEHLKSRVSASPQPYLPDPHNPAAPTDNATPADSTAVTSTSESTSSPEAAEARYRDSIDLILLIRVASQKLARDIEQRRRARNHDSHVSRSRAHTQSTAPTASSPAASPAASPAPAAAFDRIDASASASASASGVSRTPNLD